MANEEKVLFVKKVECLDGEIRSFAFNAGAIIYLQHHFAKQEKTKEAREKYNLFESFPWDKLNNAEYLVLFFYAMGLTDAEDREEKDWSIKKVERILDFKDVIGLKLLLDCAIIAAMPETEEAKKKMSKEQQKLLEKVLKEREAKKKKKKVK